MRNIGTQAFGENRIVGRSHSGIAGGRVRGHHAQGDTIRRVLVPGDEEWCFEPAGIAGVKHLQAFDDPFADQEFSVDTDFP